MRHRQSLPVLTYWIAALDGVEFRTQSRILDVLGNRLVCLPGCNWCIGYRSPHPLGQKLGPQSVTLGQRQQLMALKHGSSDAAGKTISQTLASLGVVDTLPLWLRLGRSLTACIWRTDLRWVLQRLHQTRLCVVERARTSALRLVVISWMTPASEYSSSFLTSSSINSGNRYRQTTFKEHRGEDQPSIHGWTP